MKDFVSKTVRFDYKLSFITWEELSILIAKLFHEEFKTLVKFRIELDAEETFLLTISDEMSDDIHLEIGKRYVNTEEEIELFRVVVQDLFGKASFIELSRYDEDCEEESELNVIIPLGDEEDQQ